MKLAADAFGSTNRHGTISLADATCEAGVSWKGRAHSAATDAIATADLVTEIAKVQRDLVVQLGSFKAKVIWNDRTILRRKPQIFSDWQKDPAKRTGLNVQHTLTRGEYPTVSIEIAPIRASGSSPDWKSKITVQLTRGELTAFCSVLFGLRSKAEGSYHGDAKNKSFAVYNNGKAGVAIILSERGNQLQNFINDDDRMELAVFAVRQLSNAWKVTPSDAIALLRQSAWMDRNLS